MSKKIKIVIGILIVIVVIWGIIFAIDYNRCSNLKEPIFTISKQENDLSIKSITYQGLGYRVEVVKNVSNDYGEQITKVEMYMFNKFITGAITDLSRDNSNENSTEPERIVMVNEKLYYDTGEESTVDGRCGNMDGQITSNIASNEIPTKNNQANFEGNYSYQYGKDDTIEVAIDNKWIIFQSKSVDEFSLKFYDKQMETDKKIFTILDKSESDKYDYNIYAYKGNVSIVINGEEISLREALLHNKITMNEIIEKANKHLEEKKISGDMYKEGGTMIYFYDTYTIIKSHSLDGNRDVYIGVPEMRLNDVR